MATPEYNTLAQNYTHYYNKCLQIGPNVIAIHLKPSGILSDEVYYFLNNPKNNRDEKAQKLLVAIETQVKVDPKSLKIFKAALESARTSRSHHYISNRSLKWCITATIAIVLVVTVMFLPTLLNISQYLPHDDHFDPISHILRKCTKGQNDKLLETPPSLELLAAFPTACIGENSININEIVGANYSEFGTHLLEDYSGSQVEWERKKASHLGYFDPCT